MSLAPGARAATTDASAARGPKAVTLSPGSVCVRQASLEGSVSRVSPPPSSFHL